jgi:hypothetical protein
VLILEFNPLSADAAGHTIGEYVTFLNEQSYDLRVLKSNILGRYRLRAEDAFDARNHGSAIENVICVPNRR